MSVALVGFAVLLYGVSKTAMPVLGVLAGPLLAAVLGPTTASAFAVPLLIVGDLVALSLYRRHADWRLIWRILPGVLLGFAITALMFALVSSQVIARVLGLLILASVLLELWQRRRPMTEPPEGSGPADRLAALFFGALAGMTTMAANAGGTAMTVYLLKMRVPMLAFMGTSAWFFFVLNVAKVPVVVGLGLLTWDSLRADLAFVPVLLVGTVLGIVVFRRMNQRVFADVALALSAAASVWLLARG